MKHNIGGIIQFLIEIMRYLSSLIYIDGQVLFNKKLMVLTDDLFLFLNYEPIKFMFINIINLISNEYALKSVLCSCNS